MAMVLLHQVRSQRRCTTITTKWLGLHGQWPLDGSFHLLQPSHKTQTLTNLRTSSLPIGAVSIVVIYFFLSIKRENNPDGLTFAQRILKLDLIGASILVPAVICLLLALQWGGSTYPWKNSRIIGLFIGFGLLAIIFIYTQIRLGDRGTLPPRLFKNRNVVFALAFALFCKSHHPLPPKVSSQPTNTPQSDPVSSP